jgi:hypothetical protein
MTRLEVLKILMSPKGQKEKYSWLDTVEVLVAPRKPVMYSPMHWLALNDDFKAIKYLLSHVKPGDKECLMKLCQETYKAESALDLAG